jgi:hypothetical protein
VATIPAAALMSLSWLNLVRTRGDGPGCGAVRARPEVAGVRVGTLVSQLA